MAWQGHPHPRMYSSPQFMYGIRVLHEVPTLFQVSFSGDNQCWLWFPPSRAFMLFSGKDLAQVGVTGPVYRSMKGPDVRCITLCRASGPNGMHDFTAKTGRFPSLGQVRTHLSSVTADRRWMRMTRIVQHNKRGQALTGITIFGADLGMLSRLILSMLLARNPLHGLGMDRASK